MGVDFHSLQGFAKIRNNRPDEFAGHALGLFHYQYLNNPLYQRYCQVTGKNPSNVHNLADIPFLPIRFFREQTIITGNHEKFQVFESSGTSGQQTSRHFVADTDIYKASFLDAFRMFYGPPSDYSILALLPSYLERGNSSLVYMVDELIRQSAQNGSGFFLNELDKLDDNLAVNEKKSRKTLLIGVTYALIDFAECYPRTLSSTIIMETGGMKGRKKEMIRTEVHTILKNAFKVDNIHAEYGMTELLSQAYSHGNGIFRCPPWMKILLREEDDPFNITEKADGTVAGAINIIDLANIHSCAFIATDDAGRLHPDGSFEIMGRLDHADIRGCSMLYTDQT